MSPRFALGRENVPCVAEVVNRSLKADCTDFTLCYLALNAFLWDFCEINLISVKIIILNHFL